VGGNIGNSGDGSETNEDGRWRGRRRAVEEGRARGAASPTDWRPSMRASTKSGERPYRSDSRSAAARHCALSFGEALESEMAARRES